MEIVFIKAAIQNELPSGQKLVKILADNADGIEFHANEKDLVRFRCRLFKPRKKKQKIYRLTTNKNVSEMNMHELAFNSCYVKDHLARYQDFETDIDAREFARKLMINFGLWKSIEEHGLDADNELIDDDLFDETMHENLSIDPTDIKGLIALFYRNLWAMAEMRECLKQYEDEKEKEGMYE